MSFIESCLQYFLKIYRIFYLINNNLIKYSINVKLYSMRKDSLIIRFVHIVVFLVHLSCPHSHPKHLFSKQFICSPGFFFFFVRKKKTVLLITSKIVEMILFQAC